MEGMTLIKFLAKYADISRRGADAAVRNGRVRVGGVVVLRPETRLDGNQSVELDGRIVQAHEEKNVYIMLNKPVNYTCSAADEHAEHLAAELIDVPYRIFSAGRLDRDSEGLVIFSNDGDFINRLAHPRYGVEKLYHVTTDLPLEEAHTSAMCRGLRDADGEIRALEVKRLGDNLYSFLLNEGKKREIRRLIKAVGRRVIRLIRVRQGRLELGGLPSGKWRYLEPHEVVAAQENVGK